MSERIVVQVQMRHVGQTGVEISAGDDWPSVTAFDGAEGVVTSLNMWFEEVWDRVQVERKYPEGGQHCLELISRIAQDGGDFEFTWVDDGGAE